MRSRLSTQQILRGSVVTGLLGSTMLLPLIAATPAAAAVNLCGHPADTLPPQISSLTFSSQTVVTTHGPQSVTLTADATDTATAGAGSGVKHIRAYFIGPHGSFANVTFSRSSGTSDDGTWTGTAEFTKKDWPGAYRLGDVSINDAAGNYQDYPNFGTTASSPTAISLQTGWDSQLTLTGPTPTRPKPPTVIAGKLSAFVVSPSVVNTTKSAKRVDITARFKGHQPHVVFVNFFRPPQPGRFIDLQARLLPANHSWHGHFTVPRWVGNLKPQANLEVEFNRGYKPQFRNYTSVQLKALGFDSTVDISSTLDRTPPTLTKFTFTPNAVDTHTGVQTVAIKASATDAVSGVRQIEVSFERSANLGIIFGAGSNSAGAAEATGFGKFENFAAGGNINVRLTRTGSQWTGTATFRECIPAGKWHVDVATSDKAGNGVFYSGKKLTKLGFANTLQVAAARQYVFDPVVTAATAGGAQGEITLDFDNGVKNLTTSNLTVYAMSPAGTRYQTTLPITAIQCSNGSAFVDCSGSGGLVSSAVLHVGLTGKQHYEVWADLGATTSQITDAGGLPVSWQYAIAQVKAD